IRHPEVFDAEEHRRMDGIHGEGFPAADGGGGESKDGDETEKRDFHKERCGLWLELTGPGVPSFGFRVSFVIRARRVSSRRKGPLFTRFFERGRRRSSRH